MYSSYLLLDMSVQFNPLANIVHIDDMKEKQWILCPVCKSKTRVQIRKDTELKNFPLFCPKCRQETLVSVKELNLIVIKEPDAKTQSR